MLRRNLYNLLIFILIIISLLYLKKDLSNHNIADSRSTDVFTVKLSNGNITTLEGRMMLSNCQESYRFDNGETNDFSINLSFNQVLNPTTLVLGDFRDDIYRFRGFCNFYLSELSNNNSKYTKTTDGKNLRLVSKNNFLLEFKFIFKSN